MRFQPHLNSNPTDKWFGLSLAAMMLCIAGVAWLSWHSLTLGYVIAAAGILQLGLYYGVPRSQKIIARIFFTLAWPAATLISVFMLAALYYLILTPIGVALRALDKDPLAKDFLEPNESNWVISVDSKEIESYFRQY